MPMMFAMSVLVSWTPHPSTPANAGYVIERMVGDGNWEIGGVVPAGATTFEDVNVAAGLVYHYRVRAFTDTEVSLPSAEVHVDLNGTFDGPTGVQAALKIQ